MSRNGVPVPLSQVARIEQGHEEAIFWRRNRDMAITVRADVATASRRPTCRPAIWPALPTSATSCRPATGSKSGGAIEESAKANAAIFALFPVMIVVMLTILMIQLQNFSRLALVILTAPLGIIGATLGLIIAGKPFGFVALLGLIALAGMIMRNTVILVDQIEPDVAAGLDARRGDRRRDGPAGPPGGADGARRHPGHDPAVALRPSGGRWRSPSWAACSSRPC